MIELSEALERVEVAQSLDELRATARSLSAEAIGLGGIFYSYDIDPPTKSGAQAHSLAKTLGVPILQEAIRPDRRGEFDMFKIDTNVTSEIKPHDLIEVAGKTGPFYVLLTGGNLMYRDCLFYGDEKVQFFFYATWEKQPDGSGRIIIHHATTRRMEGPRPKLAADDLERVEANLKQLFTERQYVFLERPADPSLSRTIEFTWGLRP